MNGRDFTLAINQEGGREGIDSAIHLSRLIVADQNSVIHLQTSEKRLDHFPAFIVHGNADYRKALFLMLPLKLFEPGNFEFARAAPGGPEIQQHDFTVVVGKVDQLAVGILKGEIRRFVPLFAGLNGRDIYRTLSTMREEVSQRGDNCAHDGSGGEQAECFHSLRSSPFIIRATGRFSRCRRTTYGVVRGISGRA